ncbi:hypothetical protein FRZ40_15925 [Paraburkholderia azotifigens]|uniref:Uncharacterized protein n=2 Tax=Paraburkholderia azotifigens TaxID=2057004 RepID=A0A5C6VVH9_9BURK|nr:hypothetical protein [Paraburkholderia azotifigens]TXC89227.1 hypothetical protein FRZ40_15925 [Paraburkholderia azotifigens]
MSTAFRLYRGLEIYPLVFPHRATQPGRARNYDGGFDAAVRIQEPDGTGQASRSRTFRIAVRTPFRNAGDARRASTDYAEHLIETCPQGTNVFDFTS